MQLTVTVDERTCRRLHELADALGCDPADVITKGMRTVDRIVRDYDAGCDVLMVVANPQTGAKTIVDGRIAADLPLTFGRDR
jgi:methanogenic corrinoid protein MtbC1